MDDRDGTGVTAKSDNKPFRWKLEEITYYPEKANFESQASDPNQSSKIAPARCFTLSAKLAKEGRRYWLCDDSSGKLVVVAEPAPIPNPTSTVAAPSSKYSKKWFVRYDRLPSFISLRSACLTMGIHACLNVQSVRRKVDRHFLSIIRATIGTPFASHGDRAIIRHIQDGDQ